MSILLYRVDERLIHGQVVIGWGTQLRPDVYAVVDDTLVDSEWEQDLYRLALTDESEARFLSVDEARDRLPAWRESGERIVVLTRDVGTMRLLARGGAMEGEAVNLGGIHHAEGRTRVRSYLYLGDAERDVLKELESEGVDVTARDLPGSARVILSDLLEP